MATTSQTHVGRRVTTDKPTADITVYLSRTEALALVKVAETGLRVAETLGLIQNTTTSKKAIDAVQAALRL